MKIIVTKHLQYDLAEPDDKFCNDCRFMKSGRCDLFMKGLLKRRHEPQYRRCDKCLFAQVRPLMPKPARETQRYYCDRCGILGPDEVETKCLLEEVRYPNDDAHPAEYDDPACKSCGNYVIDYKCDHCLAAGNEDDKILFVDEKNDMTCHRCYARMLVTKMVISLQNKIASELIAKFGFDNDDYTREYSSDLLNDLLIAAAGGTTL